MACGGRWSAWKLGVTDGDGVRNIKGILQKRKWILHLDV